MADSHYHLTVDGQETSPPVTDPNNAEEHWHTVFDERTSIDDFGEGHTHIFQGTETTKPISREESIEEIGDEDSKGDKMTIETKQLSGHITEVKQIERNGVAVGVIKGYIATFDLDRGLDKFMPGAFLESIQEHQEKNRPIRLKDHHGRTVGGFPIETVLEDDKGLFGVGEINLEVQQGKEAFALIRQGVLSDFSIGFSSVEDKFVNNVRVISKAIVWEGSVVDEPMNPAAKITEVKAIVPFQDLPLAPQDRPWDSNAAMDRVKEFTDSAEMPTAKYRTGFVWYDQNKPDNFGSYKLPIADVVDGKMVAVPRGIFAAAAALLGARGGIDLPEQDRPKVIQHIERYYAKMGLDSPFMEDEKQYFVADDVKEWTERDIEKFLRKTGSLSKSAAKLLVSRFEVKKAPNPLKEEQDSLKELLQELKGFKEDLSK